jgi:hypothetical protein
MKSSSANSGLSSSRTNSEFVNGGVAPGLNLALADIITFLVAMVGGRKEAEVAGRAGMRDVVGVAARRDVEIMRPVAVAGRIGAAVWGGFFDWPAVGVGTTRIACPRLEGTSRDDCFKGRGAGILVARARDVGTTPYEPLIARPER